MTSHIRGLMQEHTGVHHDHRDVEEHVVAATAKATSYIGKHMSESEAHSLKHVQLGPEGWKTLSKLLIALSDKRMSAVGHTVVKEARANLFAGPAEIGKHVVAHLQKDNVLGLAMQVFPEKLRSSLLQRWASKSPTEEDIWKMMIDPTGDNLARIRNNVTVIESSALSVPKRRLRIGPWANTFDLNGVELALGITQVVFTSIAEILLHMDMFVAKFNFPYWAHAMLFATEISTGTMTCVQGLSFYCDYFFAALGINAVDAILLVTALDIHTTEIGETLDMDKLFAHLDTATKADDHNPDAHVFDKHTTPPPTAVTTPPPTA